MRGISARSQLVAQRRRCFALQPYVYAAPDKDCRYQDSRAAQGTPPLASEHHNGAACHERPTRHHTAPTRDRADRRACHPFNAAIAEPCCRYLSDLARRIRAVATSVAVTCGGRVVGPPYLRAKTFC